MKQRYLKPPICEICESDQWQLTYRDLVDRLHKIDGSFRFWTCSICGASRIYPVPDNLNEFYPNEYYAFADSQEKKKWAPRLRKATLKTAWLMRFWPRPFSSIGVFLSRGRRCVEEVSKYAPSACFSLLDVGCGSGAFLDSLSHLGIVGAGIETSKNGAATAQNRGFDCHLGSIETAPFEPNTFDIVRFNHVLEHLESPRNALIAASDLLRSGGQLVIRSPNAGALAFLLFRRDWFPLEIPRHLWHFTQSSLERLINKCGFDVITSESLGTGTMFKSSLDYRIEASDLPEAKKAELISLIDYTECQSLARAFANVGFGEELSVVSKKMDLPPKNRATFK